MRRTFTWPRVHPRDRGIRHLYSFLHSCGNDMFRYFSHRPLCQWYVLCRCVSTGSYAQTAHFTLIYEQTSEHGNFWLPLTWAGISSHVVAILILGPAVMACEPDAAETELKRSLPQSFSLRAWHEARGGCSQPREPREKMGGECDQ